MMKKYVMLVVGLLFFLSCPSGTWAQITLTVAETYPEDYPTTQGLFMFAELVKRYSHGEIVVNVKADGILDKTEQEIIEQVQSGTLDMACVSTASMIPFVPQLKVLSLPYIWRDQAHMWIVLKGDIGQQLLVEMIRSQFYGLCYYEAGARSFYTSERPIKSVADLEGLRIGVPLDPLLVELVNILEAYAIPMASSEVYDAFRKNVIDGAEQNWLAYETMGHYEVAAYYALDMHTRVPDVLIGSTVVFEKKLTPEQTALLRQAAWETQDVVIQRWNERVESSKKIISVSNNTITELNPEAFQGFVNAVQPLYRKYGADHAALIEAIRAAQQ